MSKNYFNLGLFIIKITLLVKQFVMSKESLKEPKKIPSNKKYEQNNKHIFVVQ